MNKIKTFTLLLLFSVVLLMGTSCKGVTEEVSQSVAVAQNTAVATAAEPAPTVEASTALDLEFTSRDSRTTYDSQSSTILSLKQNETTVTGSGVQIEQNVISITQAGTYILSGELTDGRIIINVPDTEKVQLVLDGVSLTCSNHAPIFIQQADKVFITLAEGSQNVLSDGAEYVTGEDDSNVDGVIFSRADLTINGSGALTITSNYKHGIVSKDDLVCTGGIITITSVNGHGMVGKDCVKILDGTFIITSAKDGIQSDNSEREDRGYIFIEGGNFTIVSGNDGIQAETVLLIEGGTFDISSSEESFAALAATGSSTASNEFNRMGMQRGGMPGMGVDTTSAQLEDSIKGLKSGVELIINGGSFLINTADDAIHTNGDLTITHGTFAISTGDDGIHADSNVIIHGGTITISSCYEGIEGSTVTINGGVISIVASDDGINAAGGSDGSGFGGWFTQNPFSTASSSYHITINGGYITISANGDGIDSNGAVIINGGTVFVSSYSQADSAIDCDGTGAIHGGTIIAVGSATMAQGFGTSSTQPSITYNLQSFQAAGTAISLATSEGTILAEYVPVNSYQHMVISSPEMKIGESYQVMVGNQAVMIEQTAIVSGNMQNNSFMNPGGGRTMNNQWQMQEIPQWDGQMQEMPQWNMQMPPDGSTIPQGTDGGFMPPGGGGFPR